MVKVKEDLTGMTFGRLTVLEQAEDYVKPSGRHEAQWLCECSCSEHKKITVVGYDLKNGKTQSCGCLHRECVAKIGRNNHLKNKYDLSNKIGVGWTSNTNQEFYFDLDDYDKIKDYYWYENIDKNGYHSLRAYDPESKKKIIMEWIICGKYFDHANLNPLDNRKSNLRPATATESAQNRHKQNNNTSGIIGVYLRKRDCRWCAQINVNKERKFLGSFDTKKDAIITRLKAEKEYFKEFAPQKHLYKQYGIN